MAKKKKKTSNKKLFYILPIILFSVVILAVIFAVVIFGFDQKKEIESVNNTDYPQDIKMWEHIFNEKEAFVFDAKPLAVVLPNHSVSVLELSKFYQGLAKVSDPNLVIVLGMNEKGLDDTYIQTCLNCNY